jgi:hypothetical protein
VAPVLTVPSASAAAASVVSQMATAVAADVAPSIPRQLLNGVVVADDPGATFEAPSDPFAAGTADAQPQPAAQPQAGAQPQVDAQPQAEAQPADQTADQTAAADQVPADNSTVFVMPYPMPPGIAAARTGPSSRPPRTTVQPPLNTTGL